MHVLSLLNYGAFTIDFHTYWKTFRFLYFIVPICKCVSLVHSCFGFELNTQMVSNDSVANEISDSEVFQYVWESMMRRI